MANKIKLPPRRGWPIYADGETLDALKRIQEATLTGKPSYTAILRVAVALLEKEATKRGSK